MEQINSIEIRIIDSPDIEKEPVAYWNLSSKVAEIYVDGTEILTMIQETEERYCEESGKNIEPGDYGHLSPGYLYDYLSEASVPGTYSYKHGPYIMCCGSCGEPGCWSVVPRVSEEDGFVIWHDFRHEHVRDLRYDLTFRFDKKQYDAEMEKLKKSC